MLRSDAWPVSGHLGRLLASGTAVGLGEGQLIERFVESNDASAFEAILKRHGPMVWGVCRRSLRDPNDAEDAFQATFLILARRAGSIGHRDRLRGLAHHRSDSLVRRLHHRDRRQALHRAITRRRQARMITRRLAAITPAHRPPAGGRWAVAIPMK